MKREATKVCTFCGGTFGKHASLSWAVWLTRTKYCSQKCAGLAWSKEVRLRRKPMQEAFERWIDKSGECWLWTGSFSKGGYGQFAYGGRNYRAPRIALELDGRPIPAGHQACHHCDNPTCVRPSHLYVGTPKQNMADAKKRGRVQAGERHYLSRLTEDDVRKIRKATGTQKVIAAQLGVTRGLISQVRSRKIWAHVP